MFSQADRFSSGNTAASGSKNRASKPCRRKPAREEYPLHLSSTLLSVLRHAPCFRPTSSGTGTKEKPREIPKSSILRLPDESSSASAAPKPSPPRRSIRRAPERKESKEGFPCEKIGKPTDHPSPNLPTNVRDFELPQSRILRMPEFRCVPNRKPSGKVPLRNTVKPLRSSGRTTKRFRFRVAQTEFFPLPGPADRAPNRSRREALRSTESRPDSPATRRNVSGSGLRKPSLSFEGTFPDEIRTGSRRRVPRQDGKRSASPDRQQPSPSEHAPLRKTCAPREHNGSRGARVIRRTARDRSRHRPVALRSGSVRS